MGRFNIQYLRHGNHLNSHLLQTLRTYLPTGQAGGTTNVQIPSK